MAGDREPTTAELSVVEAEWPTIEAQIDGLDLELEPIGRDPSEVEIRRVRRAIHRLLSAHRDRLAEAAERSEPAEPVRLRAAA